MNKEIKGARYATSTIINIAYSLFSLILLAAYIYIYQYYPFPGSLNDTLLSAATPFAALLAAVIATAIYLHYHPEDHPRKVWVNLAAGAWTWFIAEILWVVIDQPLSIADAAWVGGFVFFTIAFYHQYSIIFPSQKKLIISIAMGAWVVALTAPLLGLLNPETFSFVSYVNYYYPIADFFVGAAGIALIFVFQGGALLRPWLGLVVFGVSDLFYAWAEQAGLYESSATITLAIDASYFAAYLILGIGYIGHWALINYGLTHKRERTLEQFH